MSNETGVLSKTAFTQFSVGERSEQTKGIKMNLKELETLIEDWRLPLGPYKTVEEVYESIALNARELSADDATILACYAAQIDQEDSARVEVLSLFLQEYAAKHGTAFAKAILAELGPEGPPLLVELLGSTQQESVIPQMVETLDLKTAAEPLLVAWACALGEIKGELAKKLLHELKSQLNLPFTVAYEADIALDHIE